MQALVISERGASPEVRDIPDVDPAPGQLRVRVEATSINGFDVAVAAGKVWDQMPATFPVVLGREFAGVVESLGDGVEGFAVGDQVAGRNPHGLGGGPIAEWFTVGASNATHVPPGVSSEQAAAVGLAGVTALDLIDSLAVGPGDTVLVSGATGGVGAYAVQLATARGGRVIATARPGAANDFVRELGAAEVVDFVGDLEAAVRAIAPDGVTKVVHAAGDVAPLARVVQPGGRIASVLGATAEQIGRDDVTVTGVVAGFTAEKLHDLLEQVAAGTLSVPIAATYPLAKATDALAAFGGDKLGKIVVTTSG